MFPKLILLSYWAPLREVVALCVLANGSWEVVMYITCRPGHFFLMIRLYVDNGGVTK